MTDGRTDSRQKEDSGPEAATERDSVSVDRHTHDTAQTDQHSHHVSNQSFLQAQKRRRELYSFLTQFVPNSQASWLSKCHAVHSKQQQKLNKTTNKHTKSTHKGVKSHSQQSPSKIIKQQTNKHTKSTRKGVNQRSKYSTQVQLRPESPTVTLTWHACQYKVHKLHQRYIQKKKFKINVALRPTETVRSLTKEELRRHSS